MKVHKAALHNCLLLRTNMGGQEEWKNSLNWSGLGEFLEEARRALDLSEMQIPPGDVTSTPSRPSISEKVADASTVSTEST